MSKYQEEERFKKQANARAQAEKQKELDQQHMVKLAADKEREERLAREKAKNQEDYLRQYERQIKESKRLKEEMDKKRQSAPNTSTPLLNREEIIRKQREEAQRKLKQQEIGQSLQYDASSIKKTEAAEGGG